MADSKTVVNAAKADVAPMDWDNVEWQTVVAESGTQIVFDEIGDVFVGLYLGSRIVEFVNPKGETETFTLLTFKGTDGEIYQTNAGWKLQEGFRDIPAQSITRITRVKDVDTGRKDPMKDFRIDVAMAA